MFAHYGRRRDAGVDSRGNGIPARPASKSFGCGDFSSVVEFLIIQEETLKFKITSTCKGGPYVFCRTEPPHPNRNSSGLYRLHRVVMENSLGRLLKPHEVVHHKDEDGHNNSIDNLELHTRASHSREHNKPKPPVKVKCPRCGKRFEMLTSDYEFKRKTNKTGVYCSRSCGAMAQSQDLPHGYSRYRKGCRCEICRAANAERMRKYNKDASLKGKARA